MRLIREKTKEMNAILGERLSAEDEEAVMAEFENLEMELAVEGMPEAPPPTLIPTPLPENEEARLVAIPQRQAVKQRVAVLAEAPAMEQTTKVDNRRTEMRVPFSPLKSEEDNQDGISSLPQLAAEGMPEVPPPSLIPTPLAENEEASLAASPQRQAVKQRAATISCLKVHNSICEGEKTTHL
jgi:hypothetical protein